MKPSKALIYVCVLLGMLCRSTQAQKLVTSSPPPKFAYHLQRFVLAGTKPTIYMWTLTRPPNEAVSIDGVAFKSLASPTLRKWMIEWQNGSVPIVYFADKNLDAKLSQAEAQLATQELNDFAQFCRGHGEPFFMSPLSK